MNLLVTGASGAFGSTALQVLRDRLPDGARLIAGTRDPQRSAHLADRGVEVRRVDFDDPASLDEAFRGVDRLLLVSTDADDATRLVQHPRAVEAADRADVGLIAYTSILDAPTSTISLAEVHRATEAAIEATGRPRALLRNTWYLENEIGTVQGVLAGAPVLDPIGDARVGWVPRADLAEAAAAVLSADDPAGTYELTGPLHTYADVAAALGDVLGREVPVVPVDDDAYASALEQAGLPAAIVPGIVAMQAAIREGALEVASDDLERVLGRPATPLRDGLAAIVDTLRAAGA